MNASFCMLSFDSNSKFKVVTEFFPFLFFVNPVLESSFALAWSAKPLEFCPHEQVQTFALSSPSGYEAV